jgi:hypothetical protein
MKQLASGLVLIAVAGAASGDEPREAARYILEKHCGACHRQDSPRALPAALHVFNLNLLDFGAAMSDAQLQSARARIEQQSHFSDELFGGRVAARDVATFADWVHRELARRRADRRGEGRLPRAGSERDARLDRGR